MALSHHNQGDVEMLRRQLFLGFVAGFLVVGFAFTLFLAQPSLADPPQRKECPVDECD